VRLLNEVFSRVERTEARKRAREIIKRHPMSAVLAKAIGEMEAAAAAAAAVVVTAVS
jgi:hypothetical protein